MASSLALSHFLLLLIFIATTTAVMIFLEVLFLHLNRLLVSFYGRLALLLVKSVRSELIFIIGEAWPLKHRPRLRGASLNGLHLVLLLAAF